eukprot:PhM_4_TR10694/c0_g1_i1/m.69230
MSSLAFDAYVRACKDLGCHVSAEVGYQLSMANPVSVDLSRTTVGPVGFLAVLHALPHVLETLTHFSVPGHLLTTDDVLKFVQVVETANKNNDNNNTNSSSSCLCQLEHIDLSRNKLSNASVGHLLRLVHTVPTLIRVDIDGNRHIFKASGIKLLNELRRNELRRVARIGRAVSTTSATRRSSRASSSSKRTSRATTPSMPPLRAAATEDLQLLGVRRAMLLPSMPSDIRLRQRREDEWRFLTFIEVVVSDQASRDIVHSIDRVLTNVNQRLGGQSKARHRFHAVEWEWLPCAAAGDLSPQSRPSDMTIIICTEDSSIEEARGAVTRALMYTDTVLVYAPDTSQIKARPVHQQLGTTSEFLRLVSGLRTFEAWCHKEARVQHTTYDSSSTLAEGKLTKGVPRLLEQQLVVDVFHLVRGATSSCAITYSADGSTREITYDAADRSGSVKMLRSFVLHHVLERNQIDNDRASASNQQMVDCLCRALGEMRRRAEASIKFLFKIKSVESFEPRHAFNDLVALFGKMVPRSYVELVIEETVDESNTQSSSPSPTSSLYPRHWTRALFACTSHHQQGRVSLLRALIESLRPPSLPNVVLYAPTHHVLRELIQLEMGEPSTAASANYIAAVLTDVRFLRRALQENDCAFVAEAYAAFLNAHGEFVTDHDAVVACRHWRHFLEDHDLFVRTSSFDSVVAVSMCKHSPTTGSHLQVRRLLRGYSPMECLHYVELDDSSGLDRWHLAESSSSSSTMCWELALRVDVQRMTTDLVLRDSDKKEGVVTTLDNPSQYPLNELSVCPRSIATPEERIATCVAFFHRRSVKDVADNSCCPVLALWNGSNSSDIVVQREALPSLRGGAIDAVCWSPGGGVIAVFDADASCSVRGTLHCPMPFEELAFFPSPRSSSDSASALTGAHRVMWCRFSSASVIDCVHANGQRRRLDLLDGTVRELHHANPRLVLAVPDLYVPLTSGGDAQSFIVFTCERGVCCARFVFFKLTGATYNAEESLDNSNNNNNNNRYTTLKDRENALAQEKCRVADAPPSVTSPLTVAGDGGRCISCLMLTLSDVLPARWALVVTSRGCCRLVDVVSRRVHDVPLDVVLSKNSEENNESVEELSEADVLLCQIVEGEKGRDPKKEVCVNVRVRNVSRVLRVLL